MHDGHENEVTLGFSAQDIEYGSYGSAFDVFENGFFVTRMRLQIPGRHNIANALGAIALLTTLGLDFDEIADALSRFRGTRRRLEIKWKSQGLTVVDDYAHHPTEIQKTLVAARNRYPNRQLWAVWQPHTYSRTLTLKDAYLSSFDVADHVLVTEVYASREPFNPDFSAEQVVDSMDHPDVCFLKTNSQVTDYLIENLNRGDVVIVLSAGDANQISEEVVRSLSRNGNTNSA